MFEINFKINSFIPNNQLDLQRTLRFQHYKKPNTCLSWTSNMIQFQANFKNVDIDFFENGQIHESSVL